MVAIDSILSAQQILTLVSDAYGVSLEQLRARGKSQSVVFARHMAIHLIRQHTRMSDAEIGALVSRNRTLVHHAIDSIDRQCKTDDRVRQQVEFFSKQINSNHKRTGGMDSAKDGVSGSVFNSRGGQ